MTQPITAPRVRHMWSRLPNETPPHNEPPEWLGQVPVDPNPGSSTAPAPTPAPLPNEQDDRSWNPADTPIHG